MCDSLVCRGISSCIQTKVRTNPPSNSEFPKNQSLTQDILNINKFWTEELLKANVDRVFGCVFQRGGKDPARVLGLIPNHAYSVLRAVEARGKRFVVVRNPWGKSEWTGPWSDGSKEWNPPESLEIRARLKHSFGDDGQFVMECELVPIVAGS